MIFSSTFWYLHSSSNFSIHWPNTQKTNLYFFSAGVKSQAVNILVLRSKLFYLGTAIRLANGLSVTDRAVLGGPKVKWLCSLSCSVYFSFIIYWVKISPYCNLPKYDFHCRISLVHGLSKQYAFKKLSKHLFTCQLWR